VNQGILGVELVQKSIDEDKPYSVIFIDMRMPPGIDGLETAKLIKKLDRQVFIVVVTAFSDHSIEHICAAVKHNFLFVRKPFDFEEIYQLARTLSFSWRKSIRLKKMETALQQHLHTQTEAFNNLQIIYENELTDHEQTRQKLSALELEHKIEP
jgi:DNA-binding NtrC family response regulator